MRKQVIAALILSIAVLLCAYVYANDEEFITATAEVELLNPVFSVVLFESTSPTTYDWENPILPSEGMNFGTLVNAVPDDPTSALAAIKHFLCLVGVVTNSGDQYAIKYTGASLAKIGAPSVKLSGDAWTVSADEHYNPDTVYPAGITYGINSGESTYVVYTSNSNGTSDTIRLYFGITGDPDYAVNGEGSVLIPPTQEAGTYQGEVKLEVYAL